MCNLSNHTKISLGKGRKKIMQEVCSIRFPPSTVKGTPNNCKEWHMGHISTSIIAVARASVTWYTAGLALPSPERGEMIASEHVAIHYLERQASGSRASSIHTFLSGHGVDLREENIYTQLLPAELHISQKGEKRY